ncbi:MAG: nucleoside kinase [Anaerolineales bacterium]
MTIEITSPRPTVEVHLPDGRTLSGPRGASVGEFLQAVADPKDPVVAAIVNGDLRELTYPLRMDAEVTPITMSHPDGARIYRRSLTFLLEMAFADRFPKAKLTIDHSVASGGYYCQVRGRARLGQLELHALKEYMQKLVEADLPFIRMEVPLSEAIAYFEQQGYADKVHLLSYRHKDYLTLYRLGQRMDYHHGYMVPSTGYLRWFDLSLTNGGFTLLYPRRHAPTHLNPPTQYPKLLNAFRLYGSWLERLGIDNVGALNDAIRAGRMHELVLVSEALHEQHIAEIARQIAERRDQLHVVLIAGPSSSGKTTFSRRLTVQMLARGISPFPLELDNYFVDREKTPRDENGHYDFEALEALDLDLLARDLERLTAGEAVQLPRYDFKSGTRQPGDHIQLRKGQLIILEGIHGLNPRLIPASLADKAFRVYVSALTQLNLDRHNRVSTTDTRLIRRIVRDARERGYTARQTIARWESVRRGEKRHIFPYQENADVMFNSALVYELSALKPLAEPLLRQVEHHTPEFIEARRLLAFLEWFLPVDADIVPENSLVREFLGGSVLKDFKVWGSKRG